MQNIYHMSCKVRNLLFDMCSINSNYPAHLHSLIRVFVHMKKTLHPWLSKIDQIGNAPSDLNLLGSHMFEGTFTDVAAHIIFNLR